MKKGLVILLHLFSLSVIAQEEKPVFDGHKWEALYTLPIPKDWTIERFPVPISFAPQISYKGVEDIRFTPGWAKVNSEQYWSYAFLWYLDGAVKTNSRTIERNLKAYYTGLIAANGSKIPAEKIIPVTTSFKKIKKYKNDLSTYAGTIRMLDYMGQKRIVLQCKVHVQSCPGKNNTFIFYELSPQPLSHNTWQSLDKLWLDFTCEK